MPRWVDRVREGRERERQHRQAMLPEIAREAAAAPEALKQLLSAAGVDLPLDVSLSTLKQLEQVHFDIAANTVTGVSRERFEHLLGLFLGELLVRRGRGRWVVLEDATRARPPSIAVKAGVGTVAVLSMAKRVYRDDLSKRPRRQLSKVAGAILE